MIIASSQKGVFLLISGQQQNILTSSCLSLPGTNSRGNLKLLVAFSLRFYSPPIIYNYPLFFKCREGDLAPLASQYGGGSHLATLSKQCSLLVASAMGRPLPVLAKRVRDPDVLYRDAEIALAHRIGLTSLSSNPLSKKLVVPGGGFEPATASLRSSGGGVSPFLISSPQSERLGESFFPQPPIKPWVF